MTRPDPDGGPPLPDILIVADFTQGGDLGLRLAQDIRHLAGRGLAVGLIQSRRPDPGQAIAPEVQTCLRRGLARVAGPDPAPVLILHGPSRADPDVLHRDWPGLAEAILVCHTPEDLAVQPALAPEVRLRRRAAHAGLGRAAIEGLERGLWLPAPEPPCALPPPATLRPALGWIGRPPDPRGLEAMDHVALDDLPVSVDRLVARLDGVVVRAGRTGAPDALVAAMLAAGRAVVCDPALRRHYGAGPVYARRDDVAGAVRRALSARPARVSLLEACRAGPIARIGRAARPATPPAATGARPVLCVAMQDDGLGSLTRLMALARRIVDRPVGMVSLMPVPGIVAGMGHRVDCIPSARAAGADPALWDRWFAAELARLLDRDDPALVVVDGAHLSPALVAVVASRRDCRLVWMRAPGQRAAPWPEAARWCDLLIAPGDLPGDGGPGDAPTPLLQADPPRLFDPPDLLSRADAAAALGLDPGRPAVLVQPETGDDGDVVAMLDRAMALLAQVPGLQVAVLEPPGSAVPLTLWPQATVLRGYPVVPCLRAFDLCIAEAGHATFHALMALGPPAILLTQGGPAAVDRRARARLAHARGAAVALDRAALDDLAHLVPRLLRPEAQAGLTERARALARANGAGPAATALSALARGDPQGAVALAAE